MALGASPRGDLSLGAVVPDVAMKAYDGKEYKLSDFRADAEKKREGQVVVVYFQSEKCPAAIDPDVIKKTTAAWADPKADVKFLAVYAYPHDTEKNIEKYIKKNKLAYPCSFDSEKKLRDHFGAKQVNTTYVLDKDGKLVYRGGFTSKDHDFVVEAVKAAKDGSEPPKSDQKFAGCGL